VRVVAQAIEAAEDDEARVGTTPGSNPATAAWIVVLVLAGLAVALIVTMAFSATNTGQSVDGRTATSWSPEPGN
jgi:hypothetical protein